MITNRLTLLSKNDILFAPANIYIHPPTLKEIGFFEKQQYFFEGCQYLTFSKDKLSTQDKKSLQSISNFDILMTMIMSKQFSATQAYKHFMEVLALLFPQYKINFLPSSIILSQGENRNIIDRENYDTFSQVIKEIFCLNEVFGDQKYNPSGPMAKKLVQKFKQRRKLLSKKKGNEDISILQQYVSTLAIGQRIDINTIMQYTIYQLFDQYHRYQLQLGFDMYMDARLAGAQGLTEPDSWMDDIYIKKRNDDQLIRRKNL